MTDVEKIKELIAQKIEQTCWRVYVYNEEPCSRCKETARIARSETLSLD